LDNLRAAFVWSRSVAEPEPALRIATALYGLWRKHARLVEGAAWLDEALSDALPVDGPDPVDATVRLRALLVRCRLESREDGEQAATRVEESVRLARAAGDKRLLAHALIGGPGYFARGPRRHRQSLLEALALAEEVGDAGLQAEARAWLGIVAILAGDPPTAIAQLSMAQAPAAEAGDTHAIRSIAALIGMARLMQGQAATASRALGKLAADFPAAPPESAKIIILAMSGWAAAVGGDHDTAAALGARAVALTRPRARWLTLFARLPAGIAALAAGHAEEAVDQLTQGWGESGGAPGWGDLMLATLAEARFAAGDIDRAQEAAAEVLSRCAGEPMWWQEGVARLVLARIARERGDAARADQLALEALGLYVSVEAEGPVADVLEFLAAGLAATDAVGGARLLGAATAIRDRLGYQRFRVYDDAIAAAVAAVETALGPDAEAVRAEGVALSVAEAVAYAGRARGCRGRPPTGWESLTPTEADVVRLVAEGLRNKDIAARMFASPRTVQTHLTHVYAKLGVSSRVQLVNEVARLREATQAAGPARRTCD
jgi:DNA-binding CsgD family transcriptional regulator